MASFRRDLGYGAFFLNPCCVVPDLGCTSAHDPPPAEGGLAQGAAVTAWDPSNAISFDVLKGRPFQNTGSGRVRILKLRTKSLLRGSQKRFRSKF